MFNHTDGKVIVYKKIAPNRNLVTLASAYDHNCSGQETCEVSDEVLEFMLKEERKSNSRGRRERMIRGKMPKNDKELDDLDLIMPSAEETVIEAEDRKEAQKEEAIIENIFSHLTETQRRRLYLLYAEGLSIAEIAAMEGVADWSVRDSIRIAIKKLRKHGDFLQTTHLQEWLDLLVVDKNQ